MAEVVTPEALIDSALLTIRVFDPDVYEYDQPSANGFESIEEQTVEIKTGSLGHVVLKNVIVVGWRDCDEPEIKNAITINSDAANPESETLVIDCDFEDIYYKDQKVDSKNDFVDMSDIQEAVNLLALVRAAKAELEGRILTTKRAIEELLKKFDLNDMTHLQEDSNVVLATERDTFVYDLENSSDITVSVRTKLRFEDYEDDDQDDAQYLDSRAHLVLAIEKEDEAFDLVIDMNSEGFGTITFYDDELEDGVDVSYFEEYVALLERVHELLFINK